MSQEDDVTGTSLREVVERSGPFASVYFDSTHDTEIATRRLDLRCRSIRDKLDAAGASQRMLGALDIAFAAGPADPGRCGRALIADAATVLVDERLAEPPLHEIVRMSPLPCLLPLIEQRAPRVPHVVAVVDQVGAELRGVNGHGDTVTQSVHGLGYPRHRDRGSAQRTLQRRVQEVVRRNAIVLAQEVGAVADGVGAVAIVLAGDVTVRSALRKALDALSGSATATGIPSADYRRIIEIDADNGAPHGDRGTQLDKAVAEAAELWFDDILEHYATGRGQLGGTTTGGLPDTTAALRKTTVAQLFIDSVALGDRRVLVGKTHTEVATSAHDLTGPAELRRADEAVPVAAIAAGSDIVPLDGQLTLPDGVGALLKELPR